MSMIDTKELREGITLNIFKPEVVGLNPVTIDKPRLISLLTGEETTYYPIPLTPEILEKCGFEKCRHYMGDGHRIIIMKSARRYLSMYKNTAMIEAGGEDAVLNLIYYLHDLQSLYRSLTGGELQIDLNGK